MQDYRKKFRYLIQALENYRHITYGQFDQETSEPVQETQDAAEAIQTLLNEIDRQQKEIQALNEKLNGGLNEIRRIERHNEARSSAYWNGDASL